MRITVTVKPLSKKRQIEKTGESSFTVWVCEPPADGHANKALTQALAEHFNVPKHRVQIRYGHAYKTKVIDIFGID